MKNKTVQWILALFLLIIWTDPASAHYVWLDLSGQQTASQNDTIAINVYAHASEEDAIFQYSVSIGFDDTALGGELTFDSYALNTTDFAADEIFFPGTYLTGQSEASPGDSWVADIGAQSLDFLNGTAVSAGSDTWLFSIFFTYTNPEVNWSGDDVWIEFNSDSAGAVYWNEAGGVTDIDVAKASADFATVPVPSAGWLLGSALLGLAGLKRRFCPNP